VWLADRKRRAVKITLECFGPDALVMQIPPESTLGRDLLEVCQERGQLREVLHIPESWGRDRGSR
jgi:hypothetical protein